MTGARAKPRRPRWLKVVDDLQAGGKSVAAVDSLPGGVYRILLGKPAELSMPAGDEANEWDVVLPRPQ